MGDSRVWTRSAGARRADGGGAAYARAGAGEAVEPAATFVGAYQGLRAGAGVAADGPDAGHLREPGGLQLLGRDIHHQGASVPGKRLVRGYRAADAGSGGAGRRRCPARAQADRVVLDRCGAGGRRTGLGHVAVLGFVCAGAAAADTSRHQPRGHHRGYRSRGAGGAGRGGDLPGAGCVGERADCQGRDPDGHCHNRYRCRRRAGSLVLHRPA